MGEEGVHRLTFPRLFFEWDTGAHSAIGIFIWSTGCDEDELIESDDPRRFLFPLSEVPAANGSATSV